MSEADDDRFIIIQARDGSYAINLRTTIAAKAHHLIDIHGEHDPEARVYFARPATGYATEVGWTQAHRLCNVPPDAQGVPGAPDVEVSE
jgi:hypothetical protein